MFSVIPVLDLRQGLVVKAKAGARDAYAPIVTPLSPSADPIAVAKGLLAAWPARTMYIADLDAIQGIGSHANVVASLSREFPNLALWIDAGFAAEDQIRAYGLPNSARVVLGSESQRDASLLRSLGPAAILSLDSRDGRPLGPEGIHRDADAWPRTVVVMTLSKVGMGSGPDFSALGDVVAKAQRRTIIAAGGVRDWQDCTALRSIGVSGALVASAIHDGRLQHSGNRGETDISP